MRLPGGVGSGAALGFGVGIGNWLALRSASPAAAGSDLITSQPFVIRWRVNAPSRRSWLGSCPWIRGGDWKLAGSAKCIAGCRRLRSDYLTAFRYPLAGECAFPAELARELPLDSGWGLEIGWLCEVHRRLPPAPI